MRSRPLACLSLLLAGAALAAPSAQQIESARRALVDCRLANPEQVLDHYWLNQLTELQQAALHSDTVREDPWIGDQAVVSRLRQSGRFDLADVYAADCQASTSAGLRVALTRMRAADPIVVRNAAFVPLVTPGGEYLGVGLSFMLRDGAWRLEELDNAVLARDAESLAISMQLGARRTIDDDAVFAATCLADIPPAPMPALEADWADADADADTEADDEPDDFADNTRGAAQRLAALRFAEGRGERPSVVAKVILAEVLLRSLGFANAPKFASDQWRQRVERAERLLAEARVHSIDWLRMAPTLIWLARAHESGSGGLSIDPLLARTYLNLAASSNHPTVTELIDKRLEGSWQPLPPGTDLRFDMPVEARGCD